MGPDKTLYLADKFNAKSLERAAIVLGYGKRGQDQSQNHGESQRYEDWFAIQTIHRSIGDFPTNIYRVPRGFSARQAIGIERHFGQKMQQNLLVPLPESISEVTGVTDYSGTEGIEELARTDFDTFQAVYRLEICSQLEDSLAVKLMGAMG